MPSRRSRNNLLQPKGRLIVEEAGDVARSLEIVSSEGISLPRFNDKLILITAMKAKGPIASFDAKLRRQAIERGLVVLPQEI